MRTVEHVNLDNEPFLHAHEAGIHLFDCEHLLGDLRLPRQPQHAPAILLIWTEDLSPLRKHLHVV